MAVAVRVNWWPDGKCAKAFWTQQEIPPYKQLVADTLDWAAPAAGERWLDLGCGGGGLTRGLWVRSQGRVAEVLGVDCAAANETAYERLRQTLFPPCGQRVNFRCHDFSGGLNGFPNGSFDHAISGLSISYAEHYDAAAGAWTDAAYNRVLTEVQRVLRPGGRFVFSVNVPEPSWLSVAWRSIPAVLRTGRPLQNLKNSWRMLKYGRWLKQEARTGRFLYLSAENITVKLLAAGWTDVKHRLSYSNQAYVFRAVKPGG